MAKAQFHRHQKVWVEAVGAWANVERIIPVWARDFDEPVKITYDVGLGREFKAEELRAEAANDRAPDPDGHWRVLRARNKWQELGDCAHHPDPGTFPVVVTDEQDWGGWRTPGAEYDRDPMKIEAQARLIAASPQLLRLVRAVVEFVAEEAENAPAELERMAHSAQALLKDIEGLS